MGEKKLTKAALTTYDRYSVAAIIKQVTNGYGQMPAFGEKLAPDDIEERTEAAERAGTSLLVLPSGCFIFLHGQKRAFKNGHACLVASFARIDSHDSRESGDSHESEIRMIRANWPDVL